MKKLSLITALLSSCVALNANAYQTEATGAYEYVDMDGGKTNSAAISGKYYFNPVQTRNAPLAEAAFLDKASSIGGGYAYSKLQDDEDFGDLQFNIIGVEGEIFIPDTQFYISGALHRTNIKATINGLGSESDNGNGYEFEAGFLPVNGLLLAVGVADFSESINPVKVAKYGFVTNLSNAAVVSGDNDDTAVSLRAKYVQSLGLRHQTQYQLMSACRPHCFCLPGRTQELCGACRPVQARHARKWSGLSSLPRHECHPYGQKPMRRHKAHGDWASGSAIHPANWKRRVRPAGFQYQCWF